MTLSVTADLQSNSKQKCVLGLWAPAAAQPWAQRCLAHGTVPEQCPLPQGHRHSDRPQLAELWFPLAEGDTLWIQEDPQVDKGRVQQPSHLCD